MTRLCGRTYSGSVGQANKVFVGTSHHHRSSLYSYHQQHVIMIVNRFRHHHAKSFALPATGLQSTAFPSSGLAVGSNGPRPCQSRSNRRSQSRSIGFCPGMGLCPWKNSNGTSTFKLGLGLCPFSRSGSGLCPCRTRDGCSLVYQPILQIGTGERCGCG